MNIKNEHKVLLYTLPFLLTPFTAMVFFISGELIGKDIGYIVGFTFYWVLCWLVPYSLYGKSILKLFQQETKLLQIKYMDAIVILCLVILGSIWMYFIPGIKSVSIWIILFSPVAIITGISEEILWRGTYVSIFNKNIFLSCIYPAIGFAISHLSPQIIFPSETGVLPFIISTLFLGLAFGWVAMRLRSAKWTMIAHIIIGLLAFGEPVTSSIVRIIGK